jgi:DNA-binding helix-hairpin-helix protein with protein kinase domain
MAITAEELKEFMQDEKNKEMFDSIVTSLGYKPESSFKAVEADRDAERKRKREYQEKLTALEKKLDELENKYYIDDENTDSGKKTNAVEKLEREIAKLKQSNEKASLESKALQDRLHKSIRQTEIIKSLEQANVDPVHFNLLLSAFSNKAVVEVDDSGELVLIDNKPVSEYFKEWSNKDDGKVYLRKPENSGIGDSRMKSGGTKQMKAEAFNLLPPKERAAFMSNGGQIIE